MILASYRAVDHATRAVNELVVDDDGAYRLWRSSGVGRAGAFAGALSADTLEQVNDVIAAAKPISVGPPPGPPPRPGTPSSGTEIVSTPAGMVVGEPSTPELAAVVDLVRELAGSLVDAPGSPVAVLEARVDGGALTLSSLGDGPVAVTELAVRHWAADGSTAMQDVGVPDRADAWPLVVPLPDAAPDAFVEVTGLLAAGDRTERIRLLAETPTLGR